MPPVNPSAISTIPIIRIKAVKIISIVIDFEIVLCLLNLLKNLKNEAKPRPIRDKIVVIIPLIDIIGLCSFWSSDIMSLYSWICCAKFLVACSSGPNSSLFSLVFSSVFEVLSLLFCSEVCSSVCCEIVWLSDELLLDGWVVGFEVSSAVLSAVERYFEALSSLKVSAFQRLYSFVIVPINCVNLLNQLI